MFAGLSRLALAIIGFFIIAVLIASMAIFGWGFFQRSTADFRGETDQIEKTRADGDYRIAAYDRFFDLCASIQSKETQIANTETLLEDEPDSEEFKRNLAALRNVRAGLINEYNADARKEDTRGNFRASDLPFEIDIEGETTCVAETE